MDEQDKPVAEADEQERSSTQRIILRILSGAALLMALLGLALFWPIWFPHTVPLIKIAELKPAMNFALVRVAGKAAGNAQTFREGGQLRSLRFTVDDGTGALAVNAYGKPAEQMALFDRIPRAGDAVEVAGSLSIVANAGVSLRFQSGDAFKLRRAEKVTPPLADGRNVTEGSQALLTGAVTRVIAPRTGSDAPYVLTVRDAIGERQLAIHASVFAKIAAHDRLVPGAFIRATVTAENEQGKLMLTLGRAADLELAPPPAATTKTAPEVTQR